MTPEEALRLIEQGEGQTVEFKTSFSEEDKAVRTLCAFANADGGTVFFGVRNDGQEVGVSLGANTRENFANKLKAHTSPLLRPQIDVLTVGGQTIVAATVGKAAKGEVFAAFNEFAIRVDRTNQAMSPDEVRARLVRGQVSERSADSAPPADIVVSEAGPGPRPPQRGLGAKLEVEADWLAEPARPQFGVSRRGLRGLETEFEPSMAVEHVSGDQIPVFEWRFSGPRFHMEWQQARGSALARTHFVARFDLSQRPMEDQKVGLNEMGFEIRFHWRGRWRSELHRWVLTRQELRSPPRVHWDIGDEILPPLFLDEQEEVGVFLA